MARPVPVDLEDALAATPAARERFWSMPAEQKDAWVAYVERARFPGARRRRVADVVRRLDGTPAVREEAAAAAVPLPRDDWSVWLVGLALLAGLAAFLLWLTVFRHGDNAKPAAAVVVAAKATVPTVTGIRYQSAQFQLREAKLASRLTRRNAAKPKGIVVGQKPRHGTTVPQGTPVLLVVSNGPPGVALPDVVGLAAADAVKALQKRKLRPTLEQTPSNDVPGTVLAQRPKAGTRAKPGTAIVLQVAKGAAKPAVTRPATTQQTATGQTTTPQSTGQTSTTGLKPPATGNDYTGMRLTDAVQKIAAGRQQTIVQYVTSSEPAGVVVANAAAGSRERLQVSAGAHPKPSQAVPDVSGEDAATAQQDLAAAGFAVIQVAWPVSDASQDDVVVRQTPDAGSAISRGAAIVVYVGSVPGG